MFIQASSPGGKPLEDARTGRYKPGMDEGGNWLGLAREWERVVRESNAGQGQREALIRGFAASRRTSRAMVRRCAVALSFAERLRSEGKIEKVDQLAEVSLEKLTILTRLTRLGREEISGLLKEILSQKAGTTVRALRRREDELRGESTPSPSSPQTADALVSRLGAKAFREKAANAYAADARASGHIVASKRAVGALLGWPRVITRAEPGQLYFAARLVPATGLAGDATRHLAAATAAMALARVFTTLSVIAQSAADAERIAGLVRSAGPCGVCVLTLGGDGKLMVIHEAQRLTAPDLGSVHSASLDALFR